jgi:hypothetical protein
MHYEIDHEESGLEGYPFQTRRRRMNKSPFDSGSR